MMKKEDVKFLEAELFFSFIELQKEGLFFPPYWFYNVLRW